MRFLVALRLHQDTSPFLLQENRGVPMAFFGFGFLDFSDSWGFLILLSLTPSDQVAEDKVCGDSP